MRLKRPLSLIMHVIGGPLQVVLFFRPAGILEHLFLLEVCVGCVAPVGGVFCPLILFTGFVGAACDDDNND